MNKTNKILIALLAAQAALALITWTAVKDAPEVTRKSAFFDFKAKDVTKIEIIATQGEEIQPGIVMEKDGDNWVLASADKYPVKSEAVTELLDSLTAIEVDSPIATTAANHATLNVAKDAFDRKLVLTARGKDVTVYLGRGGRGNAHVRKGEDKNVYEAIGLSVWNINSRVSNYVDTQYVLVDAEKANKVTVTNAKGAMNIVKSGSDWDIPGAVAAAPAEADTDAAHAGTDSELPKELDKKGVKSFVEKFLDIKLVEVVGKKAEDSYGLKDGAKVVIEAEKDGKPHTVEITVGAKDDGSYRYVKSSDSEYIVKVANYGMEPAQEKTVADFLKDAAPEGEEAPAMPQGMPMGMQGMDGMQGMPPGMMMAPPQ
ncbi:MAG: DUF4340 domain-containing protein [Deltaproteobacteria bacterium]|nr:DUF4340 domain-containing protein [Deltaproteobacteria bacterium]